MRSTLAKVLCAFILIGALAACGFECDLRKDFERNDLEKAAEYPQAQVRTRSLAVRSLPVDAWVQNSDLERFLKEALTKGPPDAIAEKYGMQCVPKNQAACPDCRSCRKSFREWRMGMDIPPIFKCVDLGEVLIQADIDPGPSVRAMTYWKTTRAGRDYLQR